MAALVVVLLLMRRRKQKRQVPSSGDGIAIAKSELAISVANDDRTYLYTNTKTEVEEAPLPSHISLHKDANLKEKSKDMSIPHICHGHHGQCPWRKICHVEKFQIFIHDRCGEI